MLRQIRHISEGNFYGLHVTNKAEKLSLQKELKTLEACKDAQSHGYRKEEKELIETIKRLKRNIDEQHEHEHEKEDRSSTHPSGSPVDADELSTHHDSAFIFTKPTTGVSNVSIVIPLSPVSSSTVSIHEPDESSPLLTESGAITEMGSELHRTTGFTDCALCKLAKYERGHGREARKICTCGPEHKRHIHVDKYHEVEGKSEKKAKKHTKEELVIAVKEHDRRKSIETDHLVHAFLATLEPNKDQSSVHGPEKHHGHAENRTGAPNGHSDNNGGGGTLEGGRRDTAVEHYRHYAEAGSRRSSIGERYERVGSNYWSALEEYEAGHVPRISAQRRSSMPGSVDHLTRSSIVEQYGHGSRRGSLEEYNRLLAPRSRRGSYEEHNQSSRLLAPRSRRGSYEEHNQSSRHRSLDVVADDEQNHRRRCSFEGRRSRKSSLDTGIFQATHRNGTVSTAGDVYHIRALPQLPSINPPHQMPAYHGLVHPDNIINHHHFLPHEAERHDQLRSASFNDRNRGYHLHGNPSYSHVAAAFDRRHEQDCSNRTHHTISTLRRMLHKYQDKENLNTPNYPWPRPPIINFTTEEFQKLKQCRYLRLPRTNSDEDLELGETTETFGK